MPTNNTFANGFAAPRRLAALTVAIALAGCAVGPDYQQPDDKLDAARFASADAAFAGGTPIERFWTVFNEPTLDTLIGQALRTNHDLRIAQANLDAARALRRETQADYLPTVEAQAAHTRARTSAELTPAGQPRTTTLDTGSLDAYWELDLFGRVRRNVEASSAYAEAAAADLRSAQISVAAEVALYYFELRGAQEQFAVAKDNADNQRATLAIAQARFDAGRGTEFDVERAKAQLNLTLATLPQHEAAIATDIHRLSVLIGEQPAALRDILAPAADLPALPQLVQVGAPADLLRRRPDIRAAERRLAGATAGVGVATAELFPRVSFTGGIGFATGESDRIGNNEAATFDYGPGLTWSILDFGRIRARIRQSEARADAELAGYEQTVLRALEETENALTAYAKARQRLDYLETSVAANARAAELAHLRFESGISDFLDVLDVERAKLETETGYSRARTETATQLVALYKALGGGWFEDNGEVQARR